MEPTTLYKTVDYPLAKLNEDIEMGEIGLPELQRPFVWSRTKVRNLFDSMYRGYPIGYLLLWENSGQFNQRQIGVESKQKIPRLLIIDGQQRLTSLYAIMKKQQVLDKNYKEYYLNIAFNPLKEQFAVSNAANRKDPFWISNISELWTGPLTLTRFTNQFLDSLKKVRPITDEQEDIISDAIGKLHLLTKYSFTALELSSNVDEEDVAEIFVRINSMGVTLKQADFILTLMSVSWNEGRRELEDYCKKALNPSVSGASPFNHFIQLKPDQLVRVIVGFGFRRAVLRQVYTILRGKDLRTGELSVEKRDQQFDIIKKAQSQVIDIQTWHEFLKSLQLAGFKSKQMITSENTLLYSYVLYLIGKKEYKMNNNEIRKFISQWYFMSSLTGRYTSSPESTMESDLNLLSNIKNKTEFLTVYHNIINNAFSDDFWNITLPDNLVSSSARSPAILAYYASLNIMNANVLFSEMKVSELLSPSIRAKKASIEKHHLFPKNYLISKGIMNNKLINQVANFALVEWSDNNDISDQSPREYITDYSSRFSVNEYKQMCDWHALPDNWVNMSYQDFLTSRRKLIAQRIKEGYIYLTRA
jgi:hypothetical protein